MLSSLGISQGRRSGAFKYATTSVEGMMKSENDHAGQALLHVQEAAAKRAVIKPCTPTLTPPNEPEVINAWELMAGLEDDPPTPPCASHEPPAVTPQWMQADTDIPIVALDFDPEILSGFREALADTSPSEPTSCSVTEEEEQPAQPEKHADACDAPTSLATGDMPEKRADACDAPISLATGDMPEKRADACDKTISLATGDMPELSGIVRARINAFQEKIERRSSKGARDAKVAHLRPPGGDKKAVVYFTSLRGVRKTFVDCCSVRSILRSYGVRLDERDVSMHAVFRAELAELLGPGGFACAALPRCSSTGATSAAPRTSTRCTRRPSSRACWKGARPRRCASSGTWRRAPHAATSGSSRARRATAAARYSSTTMSTPASSGDAPIATRMALSDALSAAADASCTVD